jgi:predicted RNase H-like HicB family nuclease
MSEYIALIHKDTDSDYGVSFPDLPGCVTAGTTLDEARALAQEALALHIAGMIEDDEALPAPSSLAEIMEDRANMDAVAFLVPAPNRTPKTVRVNITLPEDALQEIDAYAEREGFTRSGFIVRAARKAILEHV